MFNLGEFSMKKTLVALAALAATASFAQSSVTLYGIADVFLGQAKGAYAGNSGLAGQPSQLVLNSGGQSGSRWGLRGSEDLGGGLKANFVMEAGVNYDTGSSAQGGLAYGRQAYVGLSGGFGDVRFGRQYPAYDEFRGAISTLGNNFIDAASNGNSGAWARVGQDYASRVDNAIRYGTPNFGGLSAAVTYALGENKAASGPNASAGRNLSLHVLYANGPITAGFAHQDEKTGGGSAAGEKHTMLGGAYDFGAFKLNAAYNQTKVKNVSNKDTEYAIGASLPLGALTVSAQIASAKEKATTTVEKGRTFSVQGVYALSKRTDTYVALTDGKVETGTGVDIEKNRFFGVGIRHRF
jgi:predicted porin